MQNNVPILVESAPGDAFDLLCDLLQEAICFSQPSEEKKTTEDLSQSWRSAIEEHGQNFGRSIRDYLVMAVRDAAEAIALTDPSDVPQLVRAFRKRRLVVFRRLAHHLVRMHANSDPEHVEQLLLSRGMLNRASHWHEYALLLQDSFVRLSYKDQQKILAWIDRGPDPEKYRRWHVKVVGQAATREQIVAYVKRWMRDRLALISEHMPSDWKSRFEELTRDLGQAAHPEFASYRTGGAFGYRSPKADNDLVALTLTETVDYLREWKPEDGWMAPSPEGLGRQLSSLVANEPGRFAIGAQTFRELDPTYVRAVVQGFEEPAKRNLRFDWGPVLELCDWAATQPRLILGRTIKEREADPDWGWTFAAISSLLLIGLESTSNTIPLGLRECVWKILARLSETSEPTAEAEAECLKANGDPITMPLNMERPKAINAVMA